MRLARFILGPIETNGYVLTGGASRSAVLVDPAEPDDAVDRFLDESRLRVTHILLTHGHCDHIGGVDFYRKRTGAPVWIHAGDAAMLADPGRNLSVFLGDGVRTSDPEGLFRDGMDIRADGICLTVLHTPGHTEGSVCLLGDGFVLSGDTLFRGSVGRTDLPGSSTPRLLDSIRRRLLPLDDRTAVYPGHGDPTEVGYERKWNPFLQGIA
jgi:glyoxylase-like metal-dependent hydrolase (beta-lactamase superfamily II)